MPYASRTCAPSTIVLALFAAVLAPSAPAHAQDGARDEDAEAVINAPGHPLLQGFRWRSIGPTEQGGRVDDLAVHPEDTRIFYVGFATGGLWKTTNNGTTFESIFDSHETHSIGALALAPSDPEVLYVGTGEANNRQSSSFGYGVYKSTDGGATFAHMGLRETQSIARVLVHPTNPDVVWVAAVGHLFGPNAARGVFKSSDGGESWRHVLAVDEDTGATDLVMDPSNPDVLFASTYQRRRNVCCFVGGGPGSGIWRSGDGGESWSPVEGGGLPAGTLGRIALAMTPADPDVVYAQIEVAADRATPLSEEEQDEWRRLARVDSLPP
ncbi:MAG: glycosyl hydrolase, partial [Gemmatimonadales bacterium]|nr:glycosyl hydrolase [Gemmatimonadales bacterium]